MALHNPMEQRQVRATESVARSMDELVKVVTAVNTNLVGLIQHLKERDEAVVDLDELEENVARLKKIKDGTIEDANQLELPALVTSEMDPERTQWYYGKRVKVVDESREDYGWVGIVTNSRNWPDNFELCVMFTTFDTDSVERWFTPKQLAKHTED